MIEPTVGRVVWYIPGRGDEAMIVPSVGYCDAHVVDVNSNTCVNLVVFDGNANMFARLNVRLLQDEDTLVPGERCCRWMPYQIGQARKHEAPAQATESGPVDRTGG